jgi:hypothetical protein
MSKLQARLRSRASNLQCGLCYFCELLMCTGALGEFAAALRLPVKCARHFQCTAEHLHPLGEGGPTTASNIVAAHAYCNRTRHRRKKPQSPAAYKARVARAVAKGTWFTAQILRQRED